MSMVAKRMANLLDIIEEQKSTIRTLKTAYDKSLEVIERWKGIVNNFEKTLEEERESSAAQFEQLLAIILQSQNTCKEYKEMIENHLIAMDEAEEEARKPQEKPPLLIIGQRFIFEEDFE